MAYFQRGDERDQIVTCQLCSQQLRERSYVNHTSDKCIGLLRLKNGTYVRCKYDSGHIIDKNKMEIHLEFCAKRQAHLREELQKKLRELRVLDESKKFQLRLRASRNVVRANK